MATQSDVGADPALAVPAEPASRLSASRVDQGEFTPAPWQAEVAVDMLGNETGKLWIIMGAQPCAYDFDRAADAALAAAAPDLYAALKEQVDGCFDPLCDVCARHEAILAKARGQA